MRVPLKKLPGMKERSQMRKFTAGEKAAVKASKAMEQEAAKRMWARSVSLEV